MAKIYGDEDANLEILEDTTISIIGYGNQGSAQANNMRDSGCNVVIGVLSGGPSWKKAKEDGFKVYEISEAAKRGDIIHMLIPDEFQAKVYNNEIAPAMEENKTLCFSHGFNIKFKEIVPPRNVNVIMIAPKSPGASVREEYKANSGVPGLLAVAQNPGGDAKEIALAMAKAVGLTRIGVVETSFKEEVETDLFGEQSVLVGGVPELMKAGFEILIDAGYQPEIAYFECINELKLIVDLIHKQGIEGMMQAVSNTAEYGGRTRGAELIDEEVRDKMRKILKEVRDGSFAREWVAENERGALKLNKMREEAKEELVEEVGRDLRKWVEIEDS